LIAEEQKRAKVIRAALFYNEPKQLARSDDPTNPPKQRYVKARQYLARWVRDLGVDDPEVSPNHGVAAHI
jgi:hypothetical protein